MLLTALLPIIMSMSIQYRLAGANDVLSIVELLKSSSLPTDDIGTSKIDFIVATGSGEKLIGCIGVERFGSDGLLRSFSVDSDYRDKTIGSQLISRLVAVSNQSGINTLHLLTTTAEKYFAAKGFSVAARSEAPGSIQSTIEFSSLCPSSSAYMVLENLTTLPVCYYKDVQILRNDNDTGVSFWSVRAENLQFTFFEVPANTIFERHQHESEQITFVMEGELFFEIEGILYKLSKGDSVVIPANKEHKVWTENMIVKAVDAWSPVNKKYT
jgi:amino-acid N-acetyltransferase